MIKKIFTKKEMVILFVFISLISLFLTSLYFFGWNKSWSFIKIPAMNPIFADMRVVQGALKTELMGLNPYITNPGDPWNRIINYPSIWLDIAKILNLENENFFLIFNLSVISIFLLICLLLLLKTKSYLFFFVIFSGSSLLGVERGNNDLLIFSIIYFSTLLLPIYSFFFLSLAAFLKIYPLALIFTLLNYKKILFAFMIVGIFVFFYHGEDIIYLITNTPKSAGLSYGSSTISKALSKFGFNVNDYLITCVLIILIFLFYLMFKNKIKINIDKVNDRTITSFLCGGLIYVGTFLLGKNFDYRLIFLILCYEFIFLTNVNKLRIFLIFNMIISYNYLILISIFGEIVGGLICLTGKLTLLFFISYFIIIILKSQTPLIEKGFKYLRI